MFIDEFAKLLLNSCKNSSDLALLFVNRTLQKAEFKDYNAYNKVFSVGTQHSLPECMTIKDLSERSHREFLEWLRLETSKCTVRRNRNYVFISQYPKTKSSTCIVSSRMKLLKECSSEKGFLFLVSVLDFL